MITCPDFKKKKETNEKIVMVTAYDYFSAKLAAQSAVDVILVGDSLGMVVKGEQNTLGVSVDEIIYHTKAVRRGSPDTFVIADMPFMSYHLSVENTKFNASRLITEGGADAVKLEGGSESRIEAIKAIIDCEIPVVGHLGLTPQSVHIFGGYKVQGKESDQADIILRQAAQIEKAGAFMLVLEAIPEGLAKIITRSLAIPVIGIGAGRYTDGQVLVFHDILGLSEQKPKFSKIFNDAGDCIRKGLTQYVTEVRAETFPAKSNVYYPLDEK